MECGNKYELTNGAEGGLIMPMRFKKNHARHIRKKRRGKKAQKTTNKKYKCYMYLTL